VDLHYRLGLVYADRGLWPLAVEEYQSALERQPGAEAVEASLVLALENMGLVGEEQPPFVAATEATDEATDAAPAD
jgi:tetratricopeptide (TPR) repeat protein